MKRLILRYAGPAAQLVKQRAQIHALPHIKVLDDSSRMLLVEVSGGGADLRAQLPDWKIMDEVVLDLPPPPSKLYRKP